MMKSYRDYLNDRKVPEGPWVVDGPRFVGADSRSRPSGRAALRLVGSRFDRGEEAA